MQVLSKVSPEAEKLNVEKSPQSCNLVQVEKVAGSSEKNKKCPRCEEDFTLKQIEDIFGVLNSHKSFRQKIIDNLNKYIKQKKEEGKPIHLNTCLRKAHFLSQIGAETLGIHPDWMVETDVMPYSTSNITSSLFGARGQKLKTSGNLETYCEERPQKKLLNYLYAKENGFGNGNGNEASGDGYLFRGRGLKQLTGRGNYKKATKFLEDVFPKEYIDLEANPDKVREAKYAVLTAIAYWEKNKIWVTADQVKESSDSGIKRVRRRVNGGTAGLKSAIKYFEKSVEILKVKECTPVVVNAKDIVTYRIYWNEEGKGKIEKHIPLVIKDEFKNKYKYIYHDKNNNEIDICVVSWHETKKKSVGNLKNSKPTHSTIISDEQVSQVSTQRRVKYDNGDVAEYGTHPTKGKIWRLYSAQSEDIKLVKMPDFLDVNKNGVTVKYDFLNTYRRYTSPGHLAAFIGALAENDFKISTSGSCFEEGTAFPSYDHSNGKSIDTGYLDDVNEQKFINAMVKFNFNKHLRGANKTIFTHTDDGGSLHDSHLHSSFDETSILIVKE